MEFLKLWERQMLNFIAKLSVLQKYNKMISITMIEWMEWIEWSKDDYKMISYK